MKCNKCIHEPSWIKDRFVSYGLNSLWKRIFKGYEKTWSELHETIYGQCRSAPNAPCVVKDGDNFWFGKPSTIWSYGSNGYGYYFMDGKSYAIHDCIAFKEK